MSNLDDKTFDRLQELCHIKCTSEEKAILINEIQKLLSYVELLDEVETANVKPCLHVLEDQYISPLRKDIVDNNLSRELLLQNAPDKVDNMIKTPPIINSNV
jgi:aspartyl-tRNA(Asn)/glutamyl-tRNA(Gln) amidotransferase subunit C